MFWFWLVLAIGIPVSLWGVLSPRSLYWRLHAWQYRDPDANEPSEAGYAFTRIGSTIALVGLVVGGIAIFSFWSSDRRVEDCRAGLLPAFEREVWRGGPTVAKANEFGEKHDVEVDADPSTRTIAYTVTQDGRVVIRATDPSAFGRGDPECVRE